MRHHHKGGALISALFITAVAAMIAVALAMQQSLLIHEGEMVIAADQSYLKLQDMQKLAKIAVKNYASQWTNAKNPPTQWLPLKTPSPQITIDDEQGKFNINNLVYAANQSQFIALLQAVVQGISQEESVNIARAMTAWMTGNSQDPYYLSLHPPYRSSQTQMSNISELRLINGVTPAIFSALKPYITALPVVSPGGSGTQSSTQPPDQAPASAPTQASAQATAPETPININSASAPVFLTTNPALTLAQAQSLVACRKRFGEFMDTQTFIANCEQPAGIPSLNNVTVTSQYFLAEATLNQGGRVLLLRSLLVTQPQKNNTLKIGIVWQEFE